MKRVIIVQARMTSTRLPGKVLMDLAGRPMLAQQLRRLKRCRLADEIVVATTANPADDPVVALAEAESVRWYRGSEQDVLSRYVEAAREARADIIIRITADCPLIDPELVDCVAQQLQSPGAPCDYASNVVQRTYPTGLDAEALYRDTLERTARLARSPSAREHVTLFIYRDHSELFLIRSVTDKENNSQLCWTVDTAEDLAMVQRLYKSLGLGERPLGYREVIACLRVRPELLAVKSPLPRESGRPFILGEKS